MSWSAARSISSTSVGGEAKVRGYLNQNSPAWPDRGPVAGRNRSRGAMAAGSAFTNGFPQLLPKGVHVPLIWLFMPQFIVLGVLVFWLIRVRFTRWYDGGSELKTDAEPMIAAAAFSPAATD